MSGCNTGRILNLDILKQNEKIYRTYYNVLKFSCKFNYTSFSKKKKNYTSTTMISEGRKGKAKLKILDHICVFSWAMKWEFLLQT